MPYYRFHSKIFLDGIESPLPVLIRGTGSASEFDKDHSDHQKGGVFEPAEGTKIPDFRQTKVTLVTFEIGSDLERTYTLESVSKIHDGWMFGSAIRQETF